MRWRRRGAVFAGGVAGGAARIGIGQVLPVQGAWPWATFVANVTGAFLLGYLLARFLQAGSRVSLMIPMVGIGVLGSYTTFSLYAAEVWDLVATGRVLVGAGYGVASVLAGLLTAFAGIRLGERQP